MRRLFAALAVVFVLAPLPACDDSETVDHVATCTVLGALVGEHLAVSLDCDFDPQLLVEFVVGCGSEEPTEAEALTCLSAIYALEECPETLPSECLLFAPGLEAL